jgi:hypothetical protein
MESGTQVAASDQAGGSIAGIDLPQKSRKSSSDAGNSRKAASCERADGAGL